MWCLGETERIYFITKEKLYKDKRYQLETL